MSDVQTQLNVINEAILKALYENKRSENECALIAVSKNFDVDAIRPTIKAGQRIFGENRVQEAQKKWSILKAEFDDIQLHLIGPLQSNKAADAVALFDVIQSVDRMKIANVLSKEMQKQNRFIPVFIQVNIGKEDQKAGIAPEEAADFLSYCKGECGLMVKGLMAIPPANEAPDDYFRAMKKLNDQLGLSELSMGMSGDFPQAIKYGATYVRVGTAIFGARD